MLILFQPQHLAIFELELAFPFGRRPLVLAIEPRILASLW